MTMWIIAVALILGVGGPAWSAELAGAWVSEDGKLAVEIQPCGDEFCGRIRWMAPKADRAGPRLDEKNPDPALRDRPLCGLQIVEGLKPDADGGWSGGRLYYPKHGRTYRLMLEPALGGRIEMRAYLGTPLLGRSETWERVERPLPPCGEPT